MRDSMTPEIRAKIEGLGWDARKEGGLWEARAGRCRVTIDRDGEAYGEDDFDGAPIFIPLRLIVWLAQANGIEVPS